MSRSRQPPGREVEKQVLVASRRRCCLCFFLNGRNEVRKGQIAHLNRDATDSRFENLVFLCLEHHEDYDGRTSQAKGFLPGEVREYRDHLYSVYGAPYPGRVNDAGAPTELEPLQEISQYDVVQNRFPEQLRFTRDPWRFRFWQVANEPEFFAYKARPADGVCLIEWIDLPDDRIVIVCIQVPGNPGTSITNSVEELCFQVCERFDIPAQRLVWIEHYDSLRPDEWDIVTFEQHPPNGPFANPCWTTMTPEMWRDLRLRPKKRLERHSTGISSKVTKLFPWPTDDLC